MREIKKIIKDMKAQIEAEERRFSDMDSASFLNEEGVILTCNEAKALIKHIELITREDVGELTKEV